MIELNACPYCGGSAKGYIKTVDAFKTIHNYYVICTECEASTEWYDTEFSRLKNGRFHVLTKKEAIKMAVDDWNNGVFDTQTRLLHMSEAEKILWYAEDLLSIAWYGAMVPVESLKWKTAWKLRTIAENQKLLKLNSGKSYDLGEVACCLMDNGQAKGLVITYMESLQSNTQ